MEDTQALMEKVRSDIQDGKQEDEIFQSLLPLLAKDPQGDGKLADLLPAIPHKTTAMLLQRMLEVCTDKKVRKIIKRSLYRLKSKGIAVEEAATRREESILRPLPVEQPKGFGTPIDFLGQRLLLLVISHRGKGLTVIQGVVSDTEGLVDVTGMEMSRKEFKSFFENFQETNRYPIVEIEASYAGFLFAEAHGLTLEKGKTPPQEYTRLKSEIEKAKKEHARPLIYSHLQAEEMAGDDLTLGRGGDLLKLDLFQGWVIEEDQIRPYADAVREAGESRIVLTESQKEARIQGVYQEALSGLFPEEKRSIYRRRLEEMAYVLLKFGKEEEAKIALVTALNLEKPINPFQPNPFLFQLVVKSLFLLLKEADEKKSDELSLIVKP